MNKILKLTIFVLVVLALLSQAEVIYISNTSATDSIVATRLADQIEQIREDNIDLQSKILTNASFQSIASRAATLGFSDSKDFVSVYTPMPIALGR
ncbi:MAG TPA: hypothetical protein VG965_03260 [Patescibacteria group bacterium]|nr:hypothetical protein [Patescibacteria group bacterium]